MILPLCPRVCQRRNRGVSDRKTAKGNFATILFQSRRLSPRWRPPITYSLSRWQLVFLRSTLGLHGTNALRTHRRDTSGSHSRYKSPLLRIDLEDTNLNHPQIRQSICLLSPVRFIFQEISKEDMVRNHIIKGSTRFAAMGGSAWWCERVRIRV